ncbi:hypothetical protein L0F63_004933, partial [Massospora cicadina]
MQLCKLCELSSESSSDDELHEAPEFEQIQASDAGIVAIKCGHVFHYACLVKQDALGTGLIDCVICMRRTRFSDMIMLNLSNSTSLLNHNPDFSSNVRLDRTLLISQSWASPDISSQARLPIKRQNRLNPRSFENFLPRDLKGKVELKGKRELKGNHVIKAILLGVLVALLAAYLSGGINRKSKDVDVGRDFKAFVDSSFYTLKKSTEAIGDLKLKLYEENSGGCLRQLWENIKEQATNRFES